MSKKVINQLERTKDKTPLLVWFSGQFCNLCDTVVNYEAKSPMLFISLENITWNAHIHLLHFIYAEQRRKMVFSMEKQWNKSFTTIKCQWLNCFKRKFLAFSLVLYITEVMVSFFFVCCRWRPTKAEKKERSYLQKIWLKTSAHSELFFC